jgi:predicted transcriptional regulator
MGKARPARVTGQERADLARSLEAQYRAGASIRELSESTGRSYGFIHRMLTDSGVPLRGRGGATRARASRLAAG